MSFLVALDAGNSRLKWGWREPSSGQPQMLSLRWDAVSEWPIARDQLPKKPDGWLISGSNPNGIDRLMSWLGRTEPVRLLQHHSELPLTLSVDHPESVGLDRLLNSLAASRRIQTSEWAVIVSIGTAVTVDRLGSAGTFEGGAILPGPRLMLESLHQQTAKLPLLPESALADCDWSIGKNTNAAITLGVHAAIQGAIDWLIQRYTQIDDKSLPRLFLTGGSATILSHALTTSPLPWQYDPFLTLDGLLIAGQQR